MKPTIVLLILSLFAIQFLPTQSVYLDAQIKDRDGEPLPHYKAFQVLFNLPTIVTGFLDYQDTERSLVQLYQYFLQEKLFKNLLHDIFRFVDLDGNGVVSRVEYETILQNATIPLAQAQRAYSLAAIENPARDLGFNDFEVAMELIFDESVVPVTFAYLRGNPGNSQNVGIDKQTLLTGVAALFARMPEYPSPGNEQLDYLFDRFDLDQDQLLNPEEFFHVLSIFLRYYKAGLSNGVYAKLVQRDNVFTLLWQRETAEAAFKVQQQQLRQSLEDFFQVAVFEQILNTISQSIFKLVDANGNGVIELEEFKNALALFQAPESEAELLYNSADTDGNGSLDFGEFTVVLESFIRKALTQVAYAIFQTNGQTTTYDNIAALWKDLAAKYNVSIGLTDTELKAMYDRIDIDSNAVLDITEFTEFTSEMLATIKSNLRATTEQTITSAASTNATNSNIESAYEEKITSDTSNDKIGAAQAILARILGKASVENSAFSSTATEDDTSDAAPEAVVTTSATTTTTTNVTTNVTSDDNNSTTNATVTQTTTTTDTDLANSLDSGHAPGIGIGFSLYDAVRQAAQTNIMDQFIRDERGHDPLSPMGMKVLLQGHLGELAKFKK